MQYRKLKCDKVVSMTDKGDRVGVYWAGTSGKKILFECEPRIAREFVRIWNALLDRKQEKDAEGCLHDYQDDICMTCGEVRI